MKKLTDDTKLISQIGTAAFERTKKFFNRPIMLENQRHDYENLLES